MCFSGDFCEKPIDYCKLTNPCDSHTNAYVGNEHECVTLPESDNSTQIELAFKCNGVCQSGFFKNTHGVCLGIDYRKDFFDSSLRYSSILNIESYLRCRRVLVFYKSLPKPVQMHQQDRKLQLSMSLWLQIYRGKMPKYVADKRRRSVFEFFF